jgi:protocatechuate 3,4-dioxygenase beta subunit
MSSLRWLALFAMTILISGPITATRAQDAPATQPSTAQSPGSLTVTVTDENGKPVQGASVTVSAPRGHRSAAKSGARPTTRPSPLAHGKTNADGVVVLDNIPPGHLNVSAHLGKSRGRQKVTLTEGEAATVTIQLVDASDK